VAPSVVTLPAGRLPLLPIGEVHRYGQLVLGQNRPLIRLSTGPEAGGGVPIDGVWNLVLACCRSKSGAGPDHAIPSWWAS
jgi:hypothetical protein